MELIEINNNQIQIIIDLANQIWPIAYSDIITKAQIDYMLNLIYNKSTLQTQMQNGQRFYVLFDALKPIGYLSIEHDYKKSLITKIHKVYLLTEYQGKGLGKFLLNKVEEISKINNQDYMILNVNKNNKARFFYESQGFKIVKEEIIDIGNGYVMDDYVMEKKIN